MASHRSRTAIATGIASIVLIQLLDGLGWLPLAHILPSSLRFSTAAIALPRYAPPAGSRPRHSRGTGARGCTTASRANLTLLAPNHQIGLTTASHPTLSWHLSSAVSVPVEVALVAPGQPKPIFVQTITSPQPGINTVQVPATAPALVPGQPYRWSVALICNPNRRSGDIIAQTLIQRALPSAELTAQLAAAPPATQVELYAERSFWYDAFTAAAAALQAQPDNATYQAAYQALLTQVELGNVAGQ